MTLTTGPDLVRFQEAKEMAGLETDAALRWLIYKHDFPPAAKIGGRLVWRRQQILDWIDNKFAEAEANQPTHAA